MRIYFVHWNQLEAEVRAAELTAAGLDVRTHWSSEQEYKWGDYLPDAVVISLDRLPSHGRAVAEWVWEAKKRQGIPIIFAGGAADKVKATREKFPKARFCACEEVVGVLANGQA
jgi:DNA-binding response OmpR family regulator